MEGSGGPNLARIVATTFAGFIFGVTAAGYLLVEAWGDYGPRSAALTVTLMVMVPAVIAVLPLLALYLRYRTVGDIRTGVLRVGLGLGAGFLLGIVTAVAFAAASGYSSATGVIVCEICIVVAGCVVGIGAGGRAWLSNRRLQA